MKPDPLGLETGILLSPRVAIPPQYLNRHGLVTGQTGTGKTTTLLTLIEGCAARGIPVFMPDVKGDLIRLGASCDIRIAEDIDVPWDRLGPDLLARALDLSDAQAAIVEIAFRVAAAQGMTLTGSIDMLAVLNFMYAFRENLSKVHGHIAIASLSVVQRAVYRLPSGIQKPFDVATLLDPGCVTLWDAKDIVRTPRLYGALLAYMLRDLCERLPEVGDVPRLVFIIDESHLLFSELPPRILAQVETTMRLIRSKGVSVIFASQAPQDVPLLIGDQCGHRIAHDRRYGIGRAHVSTIGPRGDARICGLVPITKPLCLASDPPVVPQTTREPARPLAVAPVRAIRAPVPATARTATGTDYVAAGLACVVGLLALIGFAALVGLALPAVLVGALGALVALIPRRR